MFFPFQFLWALNMFCRFWTQILDFQGLESVQNSCKRQPFSNYIIITSEENKSYKRRKHRLLLIKLILKILLYTTQFCKIKNNSAFAPIFCPAVKFLFLVKIFQFLHIFIDLFIIFSTVFFIFYVITVRKLYSKKSVEFWPFLVIFYIKN